MRRVQMPHVPHALCYSDTSYWAPYPYPIRIGYGYAPDTAPIRIRYATWRIGLRGVSLTVDTVSDTRWNGSDTRWNGPDTCWNGPDTCLVHRVSPCVSPRSCEPRKDRALCAFVNHSARLYTAQRPAPFSFSLLLPRFEPRKLHAEAKALTAAPNFTCVRY